MWGLKSWLMSVVFRIWSVARSKCFQGPLFSIFPFFDSTHSDSLPWSEKCHTSFNVFIYIDMVFMNIKTIIIQLGYKILKNKGNNNVIFGIKRVMTYIIVMTWNVRKKIFNREKITFQDYMYFSFCFVP